MDGGAIEPAWRRAALVGLACLAATFLASRVVYPDAVIGPEPILMVSLNGGVIGAFAVLPRRYLPAYLSLITVITVTIWSVRANAPLSVALLFSLSNVLAVWLYRMLALRFGGWEALRFNNRRSVAVVLGCAVGAVAAGTAASILAALAVPGLWRQLALMPSGITRDSPGALMVLLLRGAAQADGMATMAPLVSMILTRQFGPSRVPGRTRELAGWALVLVALAGFANALPSATVYLPLSVVLFAVLLVAVLRHGRQAAAVLTPVFAVAAAATARPAGELAERMSEFSWTFSSQIYALVIALVAWIVAGIVSERDDAVAALERSLTSRLRRGELRFAAALEGMADPVVMLRAGEGFPVEYANEAARRSGVQARAPVGAGLSPELGEQLRAGLDAAYRAHRLFSRDALAFAPAGAGPATRWVDVRALRVGEELLLTWRDVTGRVRAANALAASAERFRAALEGMLDPVAIVHPVGTSAAAITDFEAKYCNEAAREWAAPDGTRLPDAVSGAAGGEQFQAYASTYRTGEPLLADAVRIPAAGGQPDRYVDLRVTRLEDGLLVSWRDVTARRASQEELGRRALYDPLTGLGNRHLLRDHLHLALDGLDRDPGTLAVLYLDLDKFKDINDSLGHEAGDLVLREVGTRLAGCLRGTDTAARLAGDEFVAVARVRDAPHAAALAERLFLALTVPMTVSGRVLEVRCSLGVTTTSRADADRGPAAARGGSGDVPGQAAGPAAVGAVRHGRARAGHPPPVDPARPGRRPGRGPAPAALPADRRPRQRAGHRGRGAAAGRAPGAGPAAAGVLHRRGRGQRPDPADRGLGAARGLPPGGRLAPQHRDPAAPGGQRVRPPGPARGPARPGPPAAAAAGLDPGDLTVEITERVLVEAGPRVLADLRELTDAGCGLAIDDFGTGYSSLTYLKAFPVTTVKIDKSFVDGLGHDEEDTAIVAAVTGLARTLDLTAVAEGVESEEQAQALRRLGCHRAQGFHLGRPSPPEGVPQLLARAASRAR